MYKLPGKLAEDEELLFINGKVRGMHATDLRFDLRDDVDLINDACTFQTRYDDSYQIRYSSTSSLSLSA